MGEVKPPRNYMSWPKSHSWKPGFKPKQSGCTITSLSAVQKKRVKMEAVDVIEEKQRKDWDTHLSSPTNSTIPRQGASDIF